MSRIHYVTTRGSKDQLTHLVRQYLDTVVDGLLTDAAETDARQQPLREVVVVGNTVMHHLFCGYDLRPLACSPFETPHLATQEFTASQLKWNVSDAPLVRFLPCLGGFIGSDVLAGVIAARMDESPRLQVLVDLGTNGEIVVADAGRLLCTATAAGPAFEGARIQMGMRASRGAIDRVSVVDLEGHRELQCHVIGKEAPAGICGSGLIDAASCALELGKLAPNGRLVAGRDRLPLTHPVFLHQCDFRELQLAKGAIAAGIEILLARLGSTVEDVSEVFLCGAFGNYLDIRHARRLGLLPLPVTKVTAMGNTALLGAKLALLTCDDFARRAADIGRRAEHFGLSEAEDFMDVYVRHMHFPTWLSEEK